MSITKEIGLEEVLKDTHNDADKFRDRCGPDVTSKFVALFKDKLCDGMELPISQAVDAIDNIRRACEMEKADSRVVISRILGTAGRLGSEEVIDNLNVMIGFLHSIGKIADKIYMKRMLPGFLVSKKTDRTVANFLERLTVVADELLEDDEEHEIKEVLDGIIYNAVDFTRNIDFAFEHLEIIERDLEKSREQNQREEEEDRVFALERGSDQEDFRKLPFRKIPANRI